MFEPEVRVRDVWYGLGLFTLRNACQLVDSMCNRNGEC